MKTPLTQDQQTKVDAMLAHITSECKAVDVETAFDEMLDECYSFKEVGGIFAGMSPSRVLRECDPTAHRCGCNDYADGQDWTEIGNDTYQDDDIEEAKEAFIDGLRDELTALEEELETRNKEDETERPAIERQIMELEAQIEACENYAF